MVLKIYFVSFHETKFWPCFKIFENYSNWEYFMFGNGDFENEITRLNPSDSYAIYCRSGSRSGKAASIMHLAGFHDVSNLNGGVIDWTNDGLPLVVS
jgi:rhodanese-related sulfurtransferase